MNTRPGAVALALSLLAAAGLVAQGLVAQDLVAQTASVTPSAPAADTPAQPESPPPPTLADEIVVTANRLVTRPDEVGSAVTVIRADEIARRGAATVAEVLRTVPGLEVVRGGGPGQVTSVFLRGGNSSHALVLLDGVRVNTLTTGAFDFADLLTDQIERIEIVRGPQSSLYGSEAMAGVISIFTRRGTPGKTSVQARAEAGNDSIHRVQAAVSGGSQRFDYALSASSQRWGGVSAAAEARGNREADAYDNTTAISRLGWNVARGGRLDLGLRYAHGDAEIDGFDFVLGPIDHLHATQKRTTLTTDLHLVQPLGTRFRQTFALSVNDEELTGRDPDDPFGNYIADSRGSEFSTQTDVEFAPGGVLTFGASVEKRSGGVRQSFAESLYLRSFFVHHAWSFKERLFLTVGARRDDHSEFGGETTYRVTAAWRLPTPGTRLHASYGTGFKAPTLNDLFFPFFSNPALRPEKNDGLDFGVEQTLLDSRLSFDVTYFDQDFSDLIAFDFVTFLPQNIAAAEARGIEAQLQYRPNEVWHLTLAHTVSDSEDLATGRPLPRRPDHRSSVNLSFKPSARLTGSATWIWVQQRIDSDGSPMDDYHRLDLNLEYRLPPARPGVQLNPYFKVQNLLDQDAAELNGFTTPGIQAALGLSLGL